MENKDLKRSYTMEEMIEMFVEAEPFKPNKIRVGKFAKKLGYKLAVQKINYKQVFFYVKATD